MIYTIQFLLVIMFPFNNCYIFQLTKMFSVLVFIYDNDLGEHKEFHVREQTDRQCKGSQCPTTTTAQRPSSLSSSLPHSLSVLNKQIPHIRKLTPDQAKNLHTEARQNRAAVSLDGVSPAVSVVEADMSAALRTCRVQTGSGLVKCSDLAGSRACLCV